MSDKSTILVQEDMEGERLDIFVAEQLDNLSRSQVQKLIGDGQVWVDGEVRKASYKVREGETVVVATPRSMPILLQGEAIPLDIIYKDSDVVVINKPKGLVVHPAHGNWEHTLVNALLYHVKTLSSLNGELRPGIVHRLDKDTSGVMVVARHDTAHRVLAEQIKAHTIQREYLALVYGVVKENRGTIEAPIGRSKSDRKKMAVVSDGRAALSQYQVLERFEDYTLVRVKLFTGRTHQIRVHMQYIKHPVVGDPLYTARKAPFGITSQLLHACLLGFKHPRSGDYMEFSADLPPEFQQALSHLHQKTK
ncbi:MAG: RluA family pseudouridine synthase [Syntrophomonadaceae bacterium]